MIRTTIIDRTPHLRMNGVARYMLGLTSHPDPESLGVDLRVLYWGREVPAKRWHNQFLPFVKPHRFATRLNRRFLRPIAQRWSRADVIHYPFHYLPPDWTVGAGAKIVTVHGASAFSPTLWEPERGERIKRGLRLGTHLLAHVVTVSEWSKAELVKHFDLRPEQITVIPNGVELSKFLPLDKKAEIAAWLEATFGIQGPYLLHVGPCEPRKNMVRLVQAFGDLKQRCHIPHKLVLAGSPGRLSDTVRRETLQLGMTDDIIYTGAVSDEALLKLYNGTDLFVFPSLYEGFGIPVLEAMACGVPVVTSNRTALPEIAGDAAALVDDPTSIENLSYICEKVLNDSAYQATLRHRGLVRVQKYTWQACATAHLQLYKRVSELDSARC